MTSFVSHATIDCADAYRLSEWWKQLLGYVLGLGATLVHDHRGIHGPGTGWVLLADPEGNEFCLLRSESEPPAAGPGD